MSSIDQRIVQMQFDNKGFESGVRSTLDSLKKLQENLKMKGATNGLGEIDKGIKSLGSSSMSGLASSIDSVSSRFSALQVIGVTALANIANSAVNVGKNITKSLTIDPVMDGFNEYELKMNSIQTILTNTKAHGTSLDDVNSALNDLNGYSDKTIYNFAQMTDNIGKATAAGLTLKDSVTFVKGMSNSAAGFGVDAVRMAGATYQMTQALSAGVVKLQDWRSLEQAGMGGKMMQDEMISAAEGMGIFVDKSVPFRETLEQGWLTSDVYIKAMNKMAKDPSLTAAASDVTSFTKLLGTMKETVGSGWAQSFEAIFGDKNQSTKLWTGISNAFGEIVGKSTESRNAMLKFWNDAGGRSDVIKGLGNIINSIGKGLGAVKDAFVEVFPPMTGKQLVNISKGFKDLTEKFKMSDKMAGMIKATFKGVFSVMDFGKNIVITLIKAFAPMGNVFAGVGAVLLTVTSSVGKFFTAINNAAKASGLFDKISKGIENAFNGVGKFLGGLANGVEGLFSALAKLNFQPIFDFIGKLGGGIGSGVSSVFEGIGKAIGGINFNAIIGLIGALAAGKGLGAMKSVVDTVKDSLESILGITDSVSGILDGVRESLQAYQDNLNAGTLLKLAIAIGILAASLAILSTIDAAKMETALTGITMLFIELIAGLALLLKVVAGTSLKGFFGVTTAMVTMAAGILILSIALKNISDLSWEELAVGLVGIAGAMGILVAATKLLSGSSKGLIKTATGMIVLSVAIKSMAEAVKMFGQLKPEELMKGLLGVGIVLAELALFLSFTDFSGMGIKNSVGILILAGALNVLAMAVSKFGSLNAGTLIQGLAGVGAILLELTLFMKFIGNGSKIVSTSVGLIALAVALNLMSNAVKSMGSLSVETISKGLVAMAGSLLIMSAAAKLIPAGALIATSVGIALMSGALMLLSSALQSMGGMSWEEIGKSMVVLAGSLSILAIAMALMTTGLAGAAAMLVISTALMLFIPQLIALSQLSLVQVGIGLIALAGAFAVIGLAGLLLAPLVPVIISLAGAVALLGLGCMAAGVGVSLFATGFAALIAVAAAGGLTLAEGLRQLIQLIPELGVKMAEGFVAFITSIGESVPQIITAFGLMISGILTAFTNALPKIADSTMKLISTIVSVINKAIPQLITLGVNIILALLDGVARNIERITTVAIDIIVKFINTISANLGKIIQAGITLAINFVNGVANGIRRNAPAVTSAFLNLISACIGAVGGAIVQFVGKGAEAVGKFISGLVSGLGKVLSTGLQIATNAVNGAKSGASKMVSVGTNMISGFINGIKSKASAAVTAAKGVVQGAIDAARNLLGIHSPSRVFAGIGKFTIMGFAKGIRDNMVIAVDSTKDLAKSAIDNMRNPLKKVAQLISGNVDASPVISPVMDLSNIEKGSRTLKQMIADNGGLQLDANASGGISKTIKRIQNGNDNSDLLSALKDLKTEIANVGGNTYQVNGVTYDDGSNVSSALESLVHAAKIERRI